MEGADFDILLKKLVSGDEGSWSDLRQHMDILIRAWARKEKIELDWAVSGRQICDGETIVQEVYTKFRNDLMSGINHISAYKEYKTHVLSLVREVLNKSFVDFLRLLESKNNLAWQRVYERLLPYTSRWLSEKDLHPEDGKELYQESMLVFFEKLTTSQLSFDTSRELKSYYFRILEIKVFEGRRKMKLRQQRWSELHQDHCLRIVSEENRELGDDYYYIEKIMEDELLPDERYILKRFYFFEEKLRKIAGDLGISDVNCRQKKHQAIRKIDQSYQKLTADGPKILNNGS